MIKVNANSNVRKYYCEVCDVYARCQKTYDLHLNGRKHKEKQNTPGKAQATQER